MLLAKKSEKSLISFFSKKVRYGSVLKSVILAPKEGLTPLDLRAQISVIVCLLSWIRNFFEKMIEKVIFHTGHVILRSHISGGKNPIYK